MQIKQWILAAAVMLALPAQAESCGLGPPPTSPDYAAHQAHVAETLARLGYVAVCGGDLDRYEISARLQPLTVALQGLPFRPVELAGTPLAGLASLGGMTEDVGHTRSRLYRRFRMSDGHVLTLFEHDMSADGVTMWRDPKDEPDRVGASPARLMVMQAPNGKAVSSLSWVEGRRYFEIWLDANVALERRRGEIFALAESLPKSIPSRMHEPDPAPALGLGPDGIPLLPPIPKFRPGPRPTMSTVEVKASKRVAELPYRDYVEMQQQLQAYLPPGPKLVDLWFRVGLQGKPESERDAHLPKNLAVSVYSESVDAAVPVRRGAYFSLPQIQKAYDESGLILLGDVDRPWLGIWWTLRVPDGQRMTYADIRNAREQIAGVQAKISARLPRLKSVKREPYDGIKACFHDATGVILVNGKASADAAEGHCKVLFDTPALERGASIEFSGPLDVVSFIDRRYYSSK